MNKYGEILEDGSMKFVRLMPAPIEEVWSWIVEGEKRARWLGGGGDMTHAGQTVRFDFRHENLTPHDETIPEKYKEMENGVSYDVEVTSCEAPRRLVMVWPGDGETVEIDIRLSEESGKTRLELIQRGDKSADHFLGALGGWHAHLDIMAAKLAGETPEPFWTTHEMLVGQYKERAKDRLKELK